MARLDMHSDEIIQLVRKRGFGAIQPTHPADLEFLGETARIRLTTGDHALVSRTDSGKVLVDLESKSLEFLATDERNPRP